MIRKIIPAALAAATLASAASITVDPTVTNQKVIGFGGGNVYYQNWLMNSALDDIRKDIFDTAFNGLNLSLLRVGNWLQDETSSLTNDSTIITEAKNRLGDHLKVEMSSWSAPASLKGSASTKGSDASVLSENPKVLDTLQATLNTSTTDPYGKYAYAEFASWWKRSYQAYASKGIAPDYISIQNEPDMFASYEETLFAPSEQSNKAGYDKALKAVRDSINSISGTKPKILGPEPLGIGYNDFQNYMNALDDSNLDGYAYHMYHSGVSGESNLINYQNPENFKSAMNAIASSWGSDDKPIIMTEFCNMSDELSGAEETMTELAHLMQVGFTEGKLNGYIAWELFYGYHSQMIGICPGAGWDLTGEGKYKCEAKGYTIYPEYHAMRHYSKFVNPGWKVTSATSDDTNLKTVAFKSAAGDSVSLIIINRGTASVQIDVPSVTGMNVAYAVQSKENGFKSKSITMASCYVLPEKSITTLVYTKSASASAVAACTDETTDPDFSSSSSATSSGSSALSDTVVIADYSTSTDVSNWSGDFTVTYGNTAIDGVSGYAIVPLAGCKQGDDDCSYQHAIIALPASAEGALQQCSALEVTMHSQDDTTAYVNIGGAGGSSWINYKYGNQAGSESWVKTEIPLTKETDSTGTQYGSNQITFNSDASGVYISKIIATGCGTSYIAQSRLRYSVNDYSYKAQLFDLTGHLLWTGIKSEAIDAQGNLRLDVRQGAYILKTRMGVVKTIKK